jgi:hypothetical protein
VNYGDAIQQRLVALAGDFSFRELQYQPAAVGAKRCTQPGGCRKAAAVVAWPEAAVFGDPVEHRRTSNRREMLQWTWRLQLQFNAAVSLEEFENALLFEVPRIPRNPSEGRDRQVDLLLEEAEYQNPVMQQPAQGTRVTYRFTAQFTPT